jgi:hypothetical protein
MDTLTTSTPLGRVSLYGVFLEKALRVFSFHRVHFKHFRGNISQ